MEDRRIEEDVKHFQETFERVRREVGKMIVGQDEIVENVLVAICCGGHVLLEGVPGLGKTALVNAMATALELRFQRLILKTQKHQTSIMLYSLSKRRM